MRRFIFTVFLLASVSPILLAQLSAPKQPVRVCLATFKNETRQQVDPTALRDRLSVYLKRGPLSKQFGAEILPVKEDSDRTAAPEVNEQKCDFVVFSRVVLGRLNGPVPDAEIGTSMHTTTVFVVEDKKGAPSSVVTGVQFTAVRVSSGIPVLIDRVFLDKPLTKEDDLWPLLIVEQERIEAILQKKLAPKPS